MSALIVYGTETCQDTQRTMAHLDQLGIGYQYIDLNADSEARAWVIRYNGKQKTPTVKLRDRILVEPSNEELDEALRAEHVLT